MYVGYEQESISTTVKDVDDLTIPSGATHAELQATENDINYTMDNSTSPTAGTTGVGMRLTTAMGPKLFLIEDVKRIKFIRGAAADAKLNVHYLGGRDL